MNGECLKHMHTPGNAEVTGLVHVLERSQFLAMGWNRRITSFPDEPDVRLRLACVFCMIVGIVYLALLQIFSVKSDGCWSGPNHHKVSLIMYVARFIIVAVRVVSFYPHFSEECFTPCQH